MARGDKRYWVYSHDLEGDLISNIADEDSLNNAVDAAAHWLRDSYPGQTKVTVRVVDTQTQLTVWIAGPGNSIVEPICPHGGFFRGETCTKCGRVVI